MFRGYWVRPGIGPLGHHFGGIGIAGMVLMAILWVAVIALIVIGIRALILHSRRNQANSAAGAAAGSYHAGGTTVRTGADGAALLATLEGRYARGEVSRDEFLQRKQDLGLAGQVVSPPPGPAPEVTPPPGSSS